MTFIQKLQIEHPNKVSYYADGSINYSDCAMECPHSYGYEKSAYCGYPAFCGDNDRCTKCWNREMPETENTKGDTDMKEVGKTVDDLLKEVADLKEQVRVKKAQEEYDKSANELKMMYDALINSGFSKVEAWSIFSTILDKSGGAE